MAIRDIGREAAVTIFGWNDIGFIVPTQIVFNHLESEFRDVFPHLCDYGASLGSVYQWVRKMNEHGSALSIIDPCGKRLTRDMLPPAETLSWFARRKAQVICAIRGGLISREEVRDLYRISDDVLASWEKALDDQWHLWLGGTTIERYQQIATVRRKKT